MRTEAACVAYERAVGRALESKFLFLEGGLFLSPIAFRGMPRGDD